MLLLLLLPLKVASTALLRLSHTLPTVVVTPNPRNEERNGALLHGTGSQKARRSTALPYDSHHLLPLLQPYPEDTNKAEDNREERRRKQKVPPKSLVCSAIHKLLAGHAPSVVTRQECAKRITG